MGHLQKYTNNTLSYNYLSLSCLFNFFFILFGINFYFNLEARVQGPGSSPDFILCPLAITTLFQQLRHDDNKQIAFFIGHTTFHSHDHQTDNSLKESHHDTSRQTTIASLAITIFSRQPCPDSNKQVTFYPGEVTFHSHDHQTDNLLKESRHDSNRQITIVSLATTNNSDLTITSRLQSNISQS